MTDYQVTIDSETLHGLLSGTAGESGLREAAGAGAQPGAGGAGERATRRGALRAQ